MVIQVILVIYIGSSKIVKITSSSLYVDALEYLMYRISKIKAIFLLAFLSVGLLYVFLAILPWMWPSVKSWIKCWEWMFFALFLIRGGKQSFIHHYGDGYWFPVGACYEVEGNSTFLLKVFVTKSIKFGQSFSASIYINIFFSVWWITVTDFQC